MDERKRKIKELKASIKEAQDNVKNELLAIDVEEEMKLTPEEQEKKKEAFKTSLEVNRVAIKDLQQELKLTRMNKNLSPYFQWLPSLPNRRMRRAALRRKRI